MSTKITQNDITTALEDSKAALQTNDTSRLLAYQPSEQEVQDAVTGFLLSQPNWVQNAINHDAAVKEKLAGGAVAEVIKYQGLHVLAFHQKAHALYVEGKAEDNEDKLVKARNLSQGALRITNIEIHPGAKIGTNCFVDHGTSTIIGETAEIGNNVFIYHGVTLGATDGSNVRNGNRRHPKIGDNVDIANGVQILGSVTIGNNVKIGAGAKIIGNKITIEDGVTIGADVDIQAKGGEEVIIKKDAKIGLRVIIAPENGQSITIGEGAVIDPGVPVRKDVEANNRDVGIVPYVPGSTPQGKENLPITVPKELFAANADPITLVQVQTTQWFGALAKSIEALLGSKPSAL